MVLLGTLNLVSYRGVAKITPMRGVSESTQFVSNKKGQTGTSVPPESYWAGPFLTSAAWPENSWVLCRSHSPALLEAFAAEDRPPLRWPEGNRRFFPALRAVGLRFRAHWRGVSSPTSSAAFGPLCFAVLAALRFVLEAFVRKKHLLAGREYELGTTLRTLQHSIVIFHEPLSPGPVPGRSLGGLCT